MWGSKKERSVFFCCKNKQTIDQKKQILATAINRIAIHQSLDQKCE